MRLSVALALLIFLPAVSVAEEEDWSTADGWVNELAWYNEIVSGEHFNDLVATTDGKRLVSKSTVLVLHKPTCPPMVERAALPGVNHLFFVRHDLVNSAKNVWYQPIPDDDLQKRYGGNSSQPSNCLEAFFFLRGASLDAAPGRWDRNSSMASLTDWTWDCIKVELTFDNRYGDTLIIEQVGRAADSPQLRKEFIYDGETLTLTSYPGYEALVKLTDRTTVVFRVLVGESDRTYMLGQHVRQPDAAAAREQEAKAEQWSTYLVDMHYLRFVQMLKQPVFVHNYTETGYRHMRIPPAMYSLVKGYFDDNYATRRGEGLTPGELLVINKDHVKTTMVDMTQEFKDAVSSHLQPILEDWCGCALQFNVAYGIREYYSGNVLHKHVDNILTHVISALIQVDQDLGDAGEDWELEVISYDGSRRRLPMAAGDMVLYESARLIHGRPRTFQGKRYANVFFHFSPVDGWDYRMVGNDLTNGNHPWKENLNTLTFSKDKERYLTIKTEL